MTPSIPWPHVEFARKRVRVPAIAEQRLAIPARTLRILDQATQEIVRFDSDAGELAAPAAALLLWAESSANSQVDRPRALARHIAAVMAGLPAARPARHAAGALRAARAAAEVAADLDQHALDAVHAAWKQEAGAQRERPVRGKLAEYAPGDPMAEAPPLEPREREAALEDLFAFVGREGITPLAHAALAHAQFMAIRPYSGGNGTIGRALMPGLLSFKGLVRNLPVPLSAGLLPDVGAYRGALRAYREGEAAPIVEEFGRAATRASAYGRALLASLAEINERWREALGGVRRDAVAWRMLPIVMEHPLFDAALVARRVDASLVAVYSGLRTLEERGVITPLVPDATRNQRWYPPAVHMALESLTAPRSRPPAPSPG